MAPVLTSIAASGQAGARTLVIAQRALLYRIVVGPLMALLVAIAQFGAISHELSHAIDAVAQSGKTDRGDPQHVCHRCIAFGHVSAAIESALVALLLAHFVAPRPEGTVLRPCTMDAPSACCRGPPAAL